MKKMNVERQAAHEPVFSTQFVFLKESQLISPRSPSVFKESVDMGVQFEVAVTFNDLEMDRHEVCLKFSVNAFPKKHDAESKEINHATLDSSPIIMGKDAGPVYTVIVQYAGIFLIKGFDEVSAENIKKVSCPDILFPFARAHMVHLVTEAGFVPNYVAPVNFGAVNGVA